MWWVEKILPSFEFKSISLLEIPKIDPNFTEIINHIEEAHRQNSMSKPKNVLIECRKALETLTLEVKKRGFKKKIDNKPVPDWSELFKDKNTGDIIGTINQKLNAFLVPGAHAGSAISREEADFALLVTHGIVMMVSEKLIESK